MKTTHMKIITGGLFTFTAACLAVPAFAQTSAREYTLEIERQPVADALIEFSRQTGLQFGYFPETPTEKILVGPLSGRYTADAAITQLLLPSGLSFERLNERTIAITGPASTKSQRRGLLGTERKTDHRTAHSFMRLADLRLAEGPATEDVQRTGTAANARESDNNKRQRGVLAEVIVTAQKREERLQDVPISISVMAGDRLDGSTVQGVREALQTVPGVLITTNQNENPSVNIRGVAATVSRLEGSSAVGYYLDTAPFGLVRGALVPDTGAYDLERVEVLKGPQGTLYGASSLNGVIRVLTKDADLDAFDLKARGLTSTTEDGGWNYRGDMAVNVPVVKDKLAARVVAGYQNLSGWIDRPSHEDANDSESSNLRFKINAQPTDKLSIGLSAWRSRIDNGAPSLADDDRRRRTLLAEPNSDDFDLYGLKVGYEFPWFSLASMTSYLNAHNTSKLDVTSYGIATSFDFDTDAEMSSQEVVLTSTHAGLWRWTIGGLYRDAEDSGRSSLPAFNVVIGDATDTSESFAAYGEATRIFLDGRLEFTGGLRYFTDKSGVHQRVPAPGRRASDTFTAVTPRTVLTWHPNDDLMVYASYAEGFRSGQQQQALAARLIAAGGVIAATEPDTLTNYELGAKGSLLDNLIDFDAALYYIDWQDVQQTRSITVTVGTATFLASALLNGNSLSGMGFDFGLTTHPADGLTLGASISWNDLRFDSDVVSGGVPIVRKGMRSLNSPEFTFAASADYVFPLGGGGFEGRLLASANHVAKMRTANLNVVAPESSDPLWISRASFSIHSPHHWAATLFIDNAFDEDGKAVPLNVPVIAFRDEMNVRVRPRTIGVQLEYLFK